VRGGGGGFGQVCGAFERLQTRLLYNFENRLFVRSPIVTLLVLLAIALGVMAEVPTTSFRNAHTNTRANQIKWLLALALGVMAEVPPRRSKTHTRFRTTNV
jgi:hypothetical protein